MLDWSIDLSMYLFTCLSCMGGCFLCTCLWQHLFFFFILIFFLSTYDRIRGQVTHVRTAWRAKIHSRGQEALLPSLHLCQPGALTRCVTWRCEAVTATQTSWVTRHVLCECADTKLQYSLNIGSVFTGYLYHHSISRTFNNFTFILEYKLKSCF